MYTYYTPFSSLRDRSLSSSMVVPTLPVIGAVPFIGLFQTLEWLALLLMLAQQWCPQSSVLRGYRRTSILIFRMTGNICSSKNSEQANSCHTYVHMFAKAAFLSVRRRLCVQVIFQFCSRCTKPGVTMAIK